MTRQEAQCRGCGGEPHERSCLEANVPMTRTEAAEEARRRFGRYGTVRVGGDLKNPTFHVGRVPFGSFGMDVYGSGASWEEAFANADREVSR